MTAALLTHTADDYADLALSCLLPPPAQDLWSWCEQHLTMPGGQRWDPRRAELMRHWYDLIGARLALRPLPHDPYAHRVEQIYLIAAAQLAKTAMGHAALLGSIANYPRTAALYMSRKDDLSTARERKMRRQIETTPALANLLPRGHEARARALGSRSWAIGASLTNFRAANTIDDLRADAIEFADCDEFDTYPLNVEGYGDPIDQIQVRQRTFPKTRLLLGHTTPGTLTGHGWRRLCSGSHERLLIDCPYCEAAQDLDPRRVCLPGDRKLADVNAAEITAARLGRFKCAHCGELWNGADLHMSVRRTLTQRRPWCPGTWTLDEHHPQGRWAPHADFTAEGRLKRIHPTESTIRSGQASSLYSLDETLDSFAARFATALQGSQSQQQAFTNNERAEPWIHIVTEADTDDIVAQAQPPEPYQIGILTRKAATSYKLFLMFDQQGNTREHYWFPWVLRAIEPGVGSWLIDEGKAMNDAEADALERKSWMIGGVPKLVDRVGRDSGNGNYLFDAYLWAAQKPSLRMLLRGDSRLADGIPWQEVVDTPERRRRIAKPAGVREYKISPHFWRNRLWDAIRGIGHPEKREGYDNPEDPELEHHINQRISEAEILRMKWYLPSDVSDRYKASLTSEEQVVERRRVAGGYKDVTVWRPRVVTSTADRSTVREDNHWWDAEASVIAAINILRWDRPVIELPPAPTTSTPTGGFMDGYA